MLASNVRTVLKARGIEGAQDVTENGELLGRLSGEAVMSAALVRSDAADFRRRVGEQRTLRGRHGAPHGDVTPIKLATISRSGTRNLW